MSRTLKITALLAASAALVCGLVWTVVVWTPGEGVSSSQADIFDLFSAPDTPTARFQRALDHLGHEPPRAFDLNGNTVYFSINQLDKSPMQVLAEYQDEFAYQSLNRTSYTSLSAALGEQGLEDMLTGGVVPLRITPNYVTMGGGLAENGADDPRSLAALGADFADGRVDKKFRAYRHIEAFREPGARFTTVVASWSDDSFDYRKMVPGSNVAEQSGDPLVPACPGCTRLKRFEDLDADANHVDYVFAGPADVDKTLAFYDRALVERGWQHAPSSVVLARARRMQAPLPDAHLRHYERGDKTLTLVAYVGSKDATFAHLTLSATDSP
jgi:hypothetical protein